MNVSVIVTTYNSPEYLAWVLNSLLDQTVLPDEILIADDGSDHRTVELLKKLRSRSKVRIVHTYLPDDGFRLARSRNVAALKAEGTWLIFLDGDCVVAPNFIERQLPLAKRGNLLFANRKLITPSETSLLLNCQPRFEVIKHLFRGRKFLCLYLGVLRKFPRRSWKRVRGFLMCITNSDLVGIGGFDESYRSWGLEDSDFALRASRFGLALIDARYLIAVLHLFHKEPKKGDKSMNIERFEKLCADKARLLPLRSVVSSEFE